MNRRKFNLIFNIVFAVMVLGACWMAPIGVLGKIEVDVALSFVVLMAIYELQDEKFGRSGWGLWGTMMLMGIIVMTLSLRLEQAWTGAVSLALHGQFAEAAAYLDGRPHANLILFIGLAMLIVGAVGMIRLGLLKLAGLTEEARE